MLKLENDNKGYFPALTGVRALAVYLVFFHHHYDRESFWYEIADQLEIGVAIFFVLSGFLITWRYADQVSFAWKSYLVNRFARVYPMYFLITTLTFAAPALYHSLYSSETFWLYLSNITFVRGLSEQQVFTGVSQGWSLTVEEMFYLSAPIVFMLLRRSVIYLFVSPVLLLLFGFVLVRCIGPINHSGFFGSDLFMLLYTYFGRGTEFFVGIGLALLLKNRKKLTMPYATYLGIITTVLTVVFTNYLDDVYPHISLTERLITTNLLRPLCIAVLFWGLMTERTMVSRVLGSAPAVLLGKSSYVFYLIHFGIFSYHLSSNALLLFIELNVLAILLFKYVEEPLNAQVKRWFCIKRPVS